MENRWYCKYKIAHRGLHNNAFPENSLPAFQNAIDLGFAIELDIRILGDNTLVIFHDHNIKRMCGVDKSLSELTIRDLPYCKLDYTNYSIPTLQEVLELVNGAKPLMIEIKPLFKGSGRRSKYVKAIIDTLKKYNGDYAIKSFDPRIMTLVKKYAPSIPRGMLSSDFKTEYAPWLHRTLVKRLFMYNRVKPDFISYDVNALPNKRILSKGIPVLAWTVRTPAQEKFAMQYANSIIFENYTPNSNFNFEYNK